MFIITSKIDGGPMSPVFVITQTFVQIFTHFQLFQFTQLLRLN